MLTGSMIVGQCNVQSILNGLTEIHFLRGTERWVRLILGESEMRHIASRHARGALP